MSPSPHRWSRPLRTAMLVAAVSQPFLPTSFARAAEQLERLFFTPEERQQLDRQREMELRNRSGDEKDTALTVNGVVMRSSGKRTVWVNGAPSSEASSDTVSLTPNLQRPGEFFVRRPGHSSARVKVGDTIDRHSGETTLLLGEGHLATRKAVR
ncbi:hypothetical protein [Propionivibrio limicola]|uniref:hypothetical protein n=1 Tax=Propionivibrio limicola TaxID=167645 RepID=UPI001291229C|nr:hypothetical protein [Propionivibrio limicola]